MNKTKLTTGIMNMLVEYFGNEKTRYGHDCETAITFDIRTNFEDIKFVQNLNAGKPVTFIPIAGLNFLQTRLLNPIFWQELYLSAIAGDEAGKVQFSLHIELLKNKLIYVIEFITPYDKEEEDIKECITTWLDSFKDYSYTTKVETYNVWELTDYFLKVEIPLSKMRYDQQHD